MILRLSRRVVTVCFPHSGMLICHTLSQCFKRAASSGFAHPFGYSDCIPLPFMDLVTIQFSPETSIGNSILEVG